MTNPITPDTVRALLEAAQLDRPDAAVLLETWLPIAEARERLRESMPHIITAYLDACAERDRLARIIDNPGDYTVTFRKGEIPKDAHRYDSVSVAIPAADLRDHLRARLDADRAGGSDV